MNGKLIKLSAVLSQKKKKCKILIFFNCLEGIIKYFMSVDIRDTNQNTIKTFYVLPFCLRLCRTFALKNTRYNWLLQWHAKIIVFYMSFYFWQKRWFVL